MIPPVVILGQTFDIERVDRMPENAPDGAVGTTRLLEQRILVKGPQAHDQERDTVLHEVLHTLLRIMGTTLTEEQEEHAVATLAPTLLDTLRRNPDLVTYLTHELAR